MPPQSKTKVATKPVGATKSTKKKAVSTAAKAGLTVHPTHARRALSKYKMHISASAPVYIAAQCEYILAEVAEIAIKVARDNDRKRVTVADVATAIRSDRELNLAIGDISFATSQGFGRTGPAELGMLFV